MNASLYKTGEEPLAGDKVMMVSPNGDGGLAYGDHRVVKSVEKPFHITVQTKSGDVSFYTWRFALLPGNPPRPVKVWKGLTIKGPLHD